MMEGGRHSVDVPISRTLVALRRVRSLRDPATSSMSKFSALVENGDWEANTNSGISLRFEDGIRESSSLGNGFMGSKTSGMYSRKSEARCRCTPLRTGEAEGWDHNELNQEETLRNNSLTGRYGSSYRDKASYLTCATPLHDHMDVLAPDHAPIFETSHIGRSGYIAVMRKSSRYKHQEKSLEPVGDVSSCMSSSCPSVSDSFSSRSQSLCGNEVVHNVDFNHQGCGINCWPRTPRFRDSNISDVEDHPLLTREIGEVAVSGNPSLNYVSGELTTYSETPRSLSQKFRPKSFDELVGQNIVVHSLVSAISTGRITSFYLFHGPRGTGKTCASRIFAAALNCLSLDKQKPCGICRECILFFSGRNRNIKEVDSVRINRAERLRSLIKNAVAPPVSSRFKVFIIDECQLLKAETWTTLLNSIENLSRHVVFVMITPDLDNLPRSALSLSQSCYFPQIKDVDIACRLGKICMVEGLDHDQFALDFIATKSNGSLRDAEMMLDQLSLLGKRITLSLAYELIGVVSDDELLDLLDLALSSDTSNTVIRARELMRSRIDPMQLISQLANLIMDILAGNCHERNSEVRISFFGRHNSEADLQKLSHALKILSNAEKQLRMSKNQATWLTVALLQLSSMESYPDINESNLCLKKAHDNAAGRDNYNTSITAEDPKHHCSSDGNKTYKLQIQEDFQGTLETIWRKSTELCQSNSLRSFLRKQGKLVSLCVNQGFAVAELEFHHSDYASRAEKSWKLIASTLQSILGCNVEIRINLASPTSEMKNSKLKRPSFRLFSCSRRMHHELQSTAEHESDSNCSEHVTEKPMIMDRVIETCSSDCGSQLQQVCSHRTEAVTTLRNSEGNVLSTGALPYKSLEDDMPKTGLGVEPAEETDVQRNCLSRILSMHKRLCASSDPIKMTPVSVQSEKNLALAIPGKTSSQSSDPIKMTPVSVQSEKNLALAIPGKTSSQTHLCVAGPYVFCGSSDKYSTSFRDEAELREDSDVHCWRTPTFPFKKAWELRHQRRPSLSTRWVIPCATAK